MLIALPWNLLDASAYLIIGAHLLKCTKRMLLKLAKSTNMWERRMVIVATWYFIRNQEFKWTFKVAETLLQDNHDLIHKAIGWMLCEAGKRDEPRLLEFLDKHAHNMPRTMLKYAMEKFPEAKRKAYLIRKKLKTIALRHKS
jgi:3-methyladenine DNA glycosylase AlkD